eukprot:Clim_evm34s134 gene=Clim_evmTU34s134
MTSPTKTYSVLTRNDSLVVRHNDRLDSLVFTTHGVSKYTVDDTSIIQEESTSLLDCSYVLGLLDLRNSNLLSVSGQYVNEYLVVVTFASTMFNGVSEGIGLDGHDAIFFGVRKVALVPIGHRRPQVLDGPRLSALSRDRSGGGMNDSQPQSSLQQSPSQSRAPLNSNGPYAGETPADSADRFSVPPEYVSLLKNVVKLLEDGSFYFASGYDLSHRMERQPNAVEAEQHNYALSHDARFLWNESLVEPLRDTGLDVSPWTVRLIRGHLAYAKLFLGDSQLHIMLISRLSGGRAGRRFQTRGVDDDGNVANYVETEVILYTDEFTTAMVQVRGSVPLFWEQTGLQLGAHKVKFPRTDEASAPAFQKHVDRMLEDFEKLYILNLLGSSKEGEKLLTDKFEFAVKNFGRQNDLIYQWFDMHSKTKGGRYDDGVRQMIEKVGSQLHDYGFYVSHYGSPLRFQLGVVRTNCLDCLDRTNMAMSYMSFEMLSEMMITVGVTEERYLHQVREKMKQMWGLNGDRLSIIYAGTGAMRADVTAKGKRTYTGRLQDFAKSATRLVQNNLGDRKVQDTIDLLLGKAKEKDDLMIAGGGGGSEDSRSMADAPSFGGAAPGSDLNSVSSGLDMGSLSLLDAGGAGGVTASPTKTSSAFPTTQSSSSPIPPPTQSTGVNLMVQTLNAQLQSKLAEYEHEFSQYQDVIVHIGTWNVNGGKNYGAEDMLPWLHCMVENSLQQSDMGSDDPGWSSNGSSRGVLPHVYVIGFQELVDLTAGNMMAADAQNRNMWEQELVQAMNKLGEVDQAHRANLSSTASAQIQADPYVLVRSEQLVGVGLFVFVKRSYTAHVRDMVVSKVKVGMHGLVGNKGGVACRMRLFDTRICFITAHLAAGQSNVHDRNEDFHDIMKQLRFGKGRRVAGHDMIFWFGDFNYRIDNTPIDEVKELIKTQEWTTLWAHDQLRTSRSAKKAFVGFQEGALTFAPTYKYDIGTQTYDTSEKQRIPAWTDRVLWQGKGVRQLLYNRAELVSSDHRPVMAVFNVSCRIVDQRRYNEVKQRVARQLEEDALAVTLKPIAPEVQENTVLELLQAHGIGITGIKILGGRAELRVPSRVHAKLILELSQQQPTTPGSAWPGDPATASGAGLELAGFPLEAMVKDSEGQAVDLSDVQLESSSWPVGNGKLVGDGDTTTMHSMVSLEVGTGYGGSPGAASPVMPPSRPINPKRLSALTATGGSAAGVGGGGDNASLYSFDSGAGADNRSDFDPFEEYDRSQQPQQPALGSGSAGIGSPPRPSPPPQAQSPPESRPGPNRPALPPPMPPQRPQSQPPIPPRRPEMPPTGNVFIQQSLSPQSSPRGWPPKPPAQHQQQLPPQLQPQQPQYSEVDQLLGSIDQELPQHRSAPAAPIAAPRRVPPPLPGNHPNRPPSSVPTRPPRRIPRPGEQQPR